MHIENLKKAREAANLTQVQAAKKLGISDGTYKNYEQGKREPSNKMLVKIANLYNVPTDYLLGREIKDANTLIVVLTFLHMLHDLNEKSKTSENSKKDVIEHDQKHEIHLEVKDKQVIK